MPVLKAKTRVTIEYLKIEAEAFCQNPTIFADLSWKHYLKPRAIPFYPGLL
jgi:hypothetical protein